MSIGTSPRVTITSPVRSASWSSAACTAWPVPELLLLDCDQHMGSDLGEVGFDLITKMTNHHHDVLGLDRRRGRHRVAQHGMTGDLVQQLGTRGLHPLPLASCQDDDSRDRARSLVGVDRQQLAPY